MLLVLIETHKNMQRKVVILSIIMITANQQCNALPSIMGIFCHANRTPERVIEAFSRMGTTISLNAIHDSIRSLSNKSCEEILKLGQTLTAAYAFDNFDVDLKPSVPTIEKSSDTLKHLTSGLLFSLSHIISPHDLRCSAKLWKKSQLNNESDNLPEDLAPLPDWQNLLQIHPKHSELDSQGMSSRDRWNAWKFLHDLCHHGPEYFAQFRAILGEPEVIEEVPLVKTKLVPARAMDINNGTVDGNRDAIQTLLAQGGVGDPNDAEEGGQEDVVNATEHIVLFHGDLRSGEKIHLAQLRQMLERTPHRRLQSSIFVFGLFHLKMACADGIWRIFIKPKAARKDSTCIMRHVALLRWRETGTVISQPGF